MEDLKGVFYIVTLLVMVFILGIICARIGPIEIEDSQKIEISKVEYKDKEWSYYLGTDWDDPYIIIKSSRRLPYSEGDSTIFMADGHPCDK